MPRASILHSPYVIKLFEGGEQFVHVGVGSGDDVRSDHLAKACSGGTACLTFMGKRLNRTGSDIRALHSMIGFGQSEQVGK